MRDRRRIQKIFRVEIIYEVPTADKAEAKRATLIGTNCSVLCISDKLNPAA